METIIENNIITVLVRLDNEAHEKGISPLEYARRGFGITNISNRVINDFGINYYLRILDKTNRKLGHTLGPLDSTIVKQLVKEGCVVSNMRRCVEYAK